MKIAAIETFALEVPLRDRQDGGASGGATGGGGGGGGGAAPRRSSLPMLLVKLTTDEGLVGWGEAFAYNLGEATRQVLEGIVTPRCLGRDCERIEAVTGPIQREFRNSRAGPLTFALSAIDIALWDIAARRAGLPLHRLLGGASETPDPIRAYASLVRYARPEAAARAARGIVERGYRQVKLHESTYAPIAAVRKALGDSVPLMVDTSSAWDLPEALEMAERLADLGLDWLEEPTWPPEDYAALAQVAAGGRLKLAAGENAANIADFQHLCAASGVGIVQPSVAKLGGVSEMIEAFAIARTAGKTVVPHVYYLGPGLLASLHLIAALVPDSPVEHAIFETGGHPYAGALELAGGAFAVPTGPGLGLDPDPDFLARHAVA